MTLIHRRPMLGAVSLAVITLVAVGCSGSSADRGAGQTTTTQTTPTATTTQAVPAAVITVPSAGQTALTPATPIVVRATGGQLSTVTVSRPSENNKQVAGALTPDNLTWTSTEDLAYGATYIVAAAAVNPAGKTTEQAFTVTTINPAKTAYANVVPAPDVVQNTGIGVGQPMVFQFTAPVVNKAEVQNRLHVSTTPPQPGAWYWTDNQNVHYRAAQYWQPGTKIHVSADVYGLDLGNGVFGAENNAADYTVHDSWVAKAVGTTDQLTIFHNGQQVNAMSMSLGSPGFPSHEGPHVISDKQPSIIMDSCTYGLCQGQPGYYRERVALDERISNDGEFVHSAPWSLGQQGNSNVSHGCVNLSPANAQWFYDHFGLGDVVEVTNSGGPPLPIWDTYGDWELPWAQWQAGNTNS